MFKELNNHPAPCWVPGEPTEGGLYLTRWEDGGNCWFYLFECQKDTTLFGSTGSRNQMLYLDHVGGNYKFDSALRRLGKVTHHCKATPENFATVLASFQDATS